jgi:acyl carrier protein
MSTAERLGTLLQRDFGVPAERLRADATLESLDIDSLRMIEILFCVEDEFGVAVPADHAELQARLKTLADLGDYIDTLLALKAKGGA